MTEAERIAQELDKEQIDTVRRDVLNHDAATLLRSQAAEIERLQAASDFDHAEYKRLHDAQAAEIERLKQPRDYRIKLSQAELTDPVYMQEYVGSMHEDMVEFYEERNQLRAEVERLHNEVKAMECDDVGELRKEVDRLKESNTRLRSENSSHAEHMGRESAALRAELERLKQEQAEPYTYASKQATKCAQCGEHKHTPLRIDAMDGYVCLTCIDKKLGSLLGEFGYPEPEQEQANEIVSIEGMPVGMGNEPEQAEPAAYFQLVQFGNSLIHEQVVIQSKEDEGVFPLYAAPQGQTELLRQALEALEPHKSVALRWYTPVDAAIAAIKQHLGEA